MKTKKDIIAEIDISNTSFKFVNTKNIEKLYKRNCGLIYKTKSRLNFRSCSSPECCCDETIYLVGSSLSSDYNNTSFNMKISRENFIKELSELVESKGFKLDNSVYNDAERYVIWKLLVQILKWNLLVKKENSLKIGSLIFIYLKKLIKVNQMNGKNLNGKDGVVLLQVV